MLAAIGLVYVCETATFIPLVYLYFCQVNSMYAETAIIASM